VAPELRDEIAPKNIIMMGPTGVGKTEIARRLARLANSPFLKVEATKFTEVGYVGVMWNPWSGTSRSWPSTWPRKRNRRSSNQRAAELAEERLLDILLPKKSEETQEEEDGEKERILEVVKSDREGMPSTREKLRRMLRSGKLDKRYVDLEVSSSNIPMVEIFSSAGMEEMEFNVKEIFGNMFPQKKKKRRVKFRRPWRFCFRKSPSA
jgi:ATP-dependent HslUV protease ATP-binding subunit HslU